jgi:hypothetical protein
VQEPGAYDVENASVDRDRGVDHLRECRGGGGSWGDTGACAEHREDTVALGRTDAEAEVAENGDDHTEQRHRDQRVRHEEQRPGDAGAGDDAADQAERAGDQRVGGHVAQRHLGTVGAGLDRPAEDAADDVAEAGTDDDRDGEAVERSEDVLVAVVGEEPRGLVAEAREEDDREQPKDLDETARGASTRPTTHAVSLSRLE